MKEIKTLTDVLSLTKWRHHEKCENLAHPTDDQSYQDVDTLGTLFVKLLIHLELCSSSVPDQF